MLSLTFGIALVTASCNNDPGAHTTPTDASNDSGRAAVEYNSSTDVPKTDTTMLTQPAEQQQRQDRNTNATVTSPGQNTRTPSSNTTDSATTSGSANQDKRR